MSNSKKTSQFTTVNTISGSDVIPVIASNNNAKISFDNFKSTLGVTGTLTATGATPNSPVLYQPTSGDYRIRGMEDGAGVMFTVTGDNGVKASWNVTQDATGVPLTANLTDTTPDIASLVAGDRVNITKTDNAITISADSADGLDTATAGQVYIAGGAGSADWGELDGISSGSAVAGSFPVANGSGGLNFIRYQGWGQYQDSKRTVGTPTLTLTAGIKTKLTCDGGFLTINKLPSDASGPLWNTSTNKVVPIAAFDVLTLRIGFWAENYSGTNPYIEMALDIGSPLGEIVWRDVSLRKSGATVKASAAFPVFCGDTFIANGGELYLTYQGTGTCDIYAVDIMIVRESKNYV